jgi:hypothetical protein
MRKRWAWIPVLLASLIALAGCGGDSKSGVLGTTSAGTVASSTDSMTTTASNPIPLKLQGTWLVREPVLLRLKLNEGSYSIAEHSGPAEAEGDVLTFTSTCGDSSVTGVGHYRWTLKGNKLHLSVIGKDECPGRASGLSGTTFERFGY